MPLDGTTLLSMKARIIDEALRLLGPNGEKWIQGRRADRRGNHCTIGAIKLARHRLRAQGDDTERLLCNAPRRDGNYKGYLPIATFNDGADRQFNHLREIFLAAKCEAML